MTHEDHKYEKIKKKIIQQKKSMVNNDLLV